VHRLSAATADPDRTDDGEDQRRCGRPNGASLFMSSGWFVSRQQSSRRVELSLVEIGLEQVEDHPDQAPLEDPQRLGLDLPAACSRARYAWAAGWTHSWVTAMRCSAAFSWRLPTRDRRWRCQAPDKHANGAAPACMAKAASDRNRPTPATSATILAAVNTPHPGRLSSRGHTRATRRPSSAWSSFARKVSSRQRVTSSPTMATWTESGTSAKRLPFEAGGEPEAEGEIEIRQLFELKQFGESPAVE
jgi:hypothetical protein